MGMCGLPKALAQLGIHSLAFFSTMSDAVLSISDDNHLARTSWQMASLCLYGSASPWFLWCKLPAQALLLNKE